MFGDVGLGKTHLMHAIGNSILRKNKNYNILKKLSKLYNLDKPISLFTISIPAIQVGFSIFLSPIIV